MCSYYISPILLQNSTECISWKWLHALCMPMEISEKPFSLWSLNFFYSTTYNQLTRKLFLLLHQPWLFCSSSNVSFYKITHKLFNNYFDFNTQFFPSKFTWMFQAKVPLTKHSSIIYSLNSLKTIPNKRNICFKLYINWL